jgi:hypothetical protein
MNVQRGLVRPSFVLVVIAIGCGAPERPAPAGDSTLEADTTALATASQVCEPRSSRECEYRYRDESGQEQCPMSYQLCRADGFAWLPCAQYVVGPDGDPIPAPRAR